MSAYTQLAVMKVSAADNGGILHQRVLNLREILQF